MSGARMCYFRQLFLMCDVRNGSKGQVCAAGKRLRWCTFSKYLVRSSKMETWIMISLFSKAPFFIIV